MSPAFRALVGAGLRSLVRDRAALFFSFLLPIIFMTLFGVIFGGSGTSRTKLLLVGDGPLAQAVRHVPALDVQTRSTQAKAHQVVLDGDAAGALYVQGDRAELEYAQSDTTGSAVVRGIVAGLVDSLTIRRAAARPAVQLTSRQVEDDSLSYIDFFVPGILAMSLAQSAVFGMSAALVVWRTSGLLRRLQLAPVPLGALIGSRVVVSLLLAAGQAVLLLLVGVVLFGVSLKGASWAVLPLAMLGSLCFLMIGALAGSVAGSVGSAAAIANVVTLPMIFISGVFFPVDNPAWLRTIGDLLPLKHLVDALRDVSVRGHGVASTMPDVGIMLLFTVVLAAVAMRVFRWEKA